MNRYERSILFERLVALRQRYERLGGNDSTSVMAIEEALEWVSAILSTTTAEATATEPAAPRKEETSA